MDEARNTARLPNAPRACVQCREKKVRCIRTLETSEACERCERLKKECVPHIPERPRKRQRFTHRIGELEQNLGRLTTLLESAQDRHRSPLTTPDGSTPAEYNTSRTASRPHATTQSVQSIVMDPTNRLLSSDPCSSGVDMIDQGLLSIEQAETFYMSYRRMAAKFLYVIVDPDATVSHLREKSPMLLNAILVTGAYSHRSLHDLLLQRYLSLLSTKAIVGGEVSMDMLQSILIYLSWVHFHVKAGPRHTFRIASLAVSMIVDIGINRPPEKSEQQQMNIDFNQTNPPPPATMAVGYWPPDARRAFVGCYIISTTYAISGRKASPMKYSEYLTKCADSLRDEASAPTDSHIPSHLAQARYTELLGETFGYVEKSHQFQNINDDQLLTYITIFSSKLDDWKNSIPESLQGDCNLVLRYEITKAYAKEAAVHGISPDTELSITRTSMLLTCLSDVKDYMDLIISLPMETMRFWTGLDWVWLNYAVILVAKITSIHTPTWNIQTTRPILKLDHYLEHLISRVDELSRDRLPEEEPSSWCQYLLTKWIWLNAVYMSDLRATETNIAEPEASLDVTHPVPAPTLDMSGPDPDIEWTPNMPLLDNNETGQLQPRATSFRNRQVSSDMETFELPETMLPDTDNLDLTDEAKHTLGLWLSNTMENFTSWEMENTFP